MARVKGIYFTLDALFAILLIGIALVASSRLFVSNISEPQISYYPQDIIASLSNIKISEIDDPYIQSLISQGQIIHLNNTVIEQIGEFYVLDEQELAKNLSIIISSRLIPPRYGFEILINDESIYLNDSSIRRAELVSSRRLISGIEKFQPLRGATSKVFLQGISNKKYADYIYFGGFVGQGEITHNSSRLPVDAVITGLDLELDSGGDFDLYINDNFCDTFIVPDLQMVAELYNLSHCSNLVLPGNENQFKISFNDLINESYIAGGFIKINYDTEIFSDEYFEGYKLRYNFPGIDGVVNLYDAFYVPGTVKNISIFLHFKSNESTYLTIGGRKIYTWPGNESDQKINLTPTNLTDWWYSNLDDDYLLFSNNTVPVRLASYVAKETLTTTGNADIIIITDFSGSMKKAVGSWTQGTGVSDCEILYTYEDARKTHLARCVDTMSVEIMMNYSGNRIWPVFFMDNLDKIDSKPQDYYYDNPTDPDAIIDYIKKYGPQGTDQTCLACSLNIAYNLFTQYNDTDRKKFVILMTDGVPNYCPVDGCNGILPNYGNRVCWGYCDTNGFSGCVSEPTELDGCSDLACILAEDSTKFSAERLWNDFDTTIYTVGFGLVGEECERAGYLLSYVANMTNGTYQHSDNVDELILIYENISRQILMSITQENQIVSTTTGFLSNSTLYSDSFIEIEYEPIVEKPAFDEIAVAIEEDKFPNCHPTFDIPAELRVLDAKVTSYSAQHWADILEINGRQIFNLTDYRLEYSSLGDPFFTYIPVNYILNGTNTLFIETGDSPVNRTGCAYDNNTIIYTALVRASISYAAVSPKSEGCTWTVEFDDGSVETINVPREYTGVKHCSYTSGSMPDGVYDVEDSIDIATFQLFDNLDFDNDGRLFFNFNENNLIVNAISVQQIPYPWGPATAEVRVWR